MPEILSFVDKNFSKNISIIFLPRPRKKILYFVSHLRSKHIDCTCCLFRVAYVIFAFFVCKMRYTYTIAVLHALNLILVETKCSRFFCSYLHTKCNSLLSTEFFALGFTCLHSLLLSYPV